MGKKHVNDDKDESFQRAHGRRDGESPDRNDSGRERNVGHSGGEEHSRSEKGTAATRKIGSRFSPREDRPIGLSSSTYIKMKNQIDKRGNTIFIDLPKKVEKVYVSIVFPFGLHDESEKTYGQTHLLEHFVADLIDKKIHPAYINASVGNTYTRFDIDLKQNEVENSLFNALEILTKPTFNDNKLLAKEKARIQNEFYENFVDFKRWLKSESIKFLIKSPISIKRDYNGQLKNIDKASLDSLRSVHRMLLKYPFRVFIGGSKLSNSQKRRTANVVKRFTRNVLKTQSSSTEADYSNKKNKTIFHKTISIKYVHQSLIFPAFSVQNSSIPERVALAFICVELKRLFSKSITEVGIYKTDYIYTIAKNYGIVSFFSYIPKESRNDFQKMFLNVVKELLDETDIKMRLKKYISERRHGFKKLWNNNEDRMNWMIDDYIDFGSMKSLYEVQRALNSVTFKKLTLVARRVFNPRNLHILTVVPDK